MHILAHVGAEPPGAAPLVHVSRRVAPPLRVRESTARFRGDGPRVLDPLGLRDVREAAEIGGVGARDGLVELDGGEVPPDRDGVFLRRVPVFRLDDRLAIAGRGGDGVRGASPRHGEGRGAALGEHRGRVEVRDGRREDRALVVPREVRPGIPREVAPRREVGVRLKRQTRVRRRRGGDGALDRQRRKAVGGLAHRAPLARVRVGDVPGPDVDLLVVTRDQRAAV